MMTTRASRVMVALIALSLSHVLGGEPAKASGMSISVRDLSGLAARRPVTGGIPLAAGAAPADSQFVLTNERGERVPCQTSVLAHWKDDSARWVLLDFQAAPPANGESQFTLGWSGDQLPLVPRHPVQCPSGSPATLKTGEIQVGPTRDAIVNVADRLNVRLTLTDERGRRCAGRVESGDIEAAGPLRGDLLLRGGFRSPDGERLLGFRLRVSVFAGCSAVRLEPHLLVDADEGVVQRLRGLTLEIQPRTESRGLSLSGLKVKPSKTRVRLLQIDDQTYRCEGLEAGGSKAPGWAELTDAQGTVAVAVRDFWQQWPKSLESDSGGLAVGLLPTFKTGTFDHVGPWYKHQYAFDADCYRLRTGQSR